MPDHDKHLVSIPKGLVTTVGRELVLTEKLLATQLNPPLLVPQFWHPGTLAFSPDSRTIALGGDHSIRLWDIENGVCLQELVGHLAEVKAMAFSSSGRMVASIGWNQHTIYLWQVNKRELHKKFKCPLGDIQNIAFTPDDQIIILVSEGDTTSIWDVEKAERLRVVEACPEDIWKNTAFSPDGRVVSVLDGKTSGLWETESGKCLRGAETEEINWSSSLAIALSNDGQMIAEGWADGTLRLWNVGSGECLWRITVPSEPIIESIAFSFDGQMVAVGGDHDVSLWDVKTGKCLNVLGYRAEIFSVSFASNHKLMVVGTWDKVIYIRETGSDVRTPPIIDWEFPQMHSAVFAPNAEMLADKMHDGTIRLWEPRSGKWVKDLGAHSGHVMFVIFSPDGRMIAAGGHDGTIRLWDIESGQCQQIIETHSGRVWSAAFSPDGQILVSLGEDDNICLWSLASGNSLWSLVAPLKEMYRVCFSPDGKTIASGEEDDMIFLWSVEDGKLLKKLDARDCYFDSLVFSPDGRMIIAIGGDDTYLLDTEGLIGLRKLNIPSSSSAKPMAFSSDGQMIAIGSGDGKIFILDASTYVCEATIYYFPGNAWAVVAPDGRYDSSDFGESTWLRWTVGTKSYPVTHFKDRFYSPGLFAQIMAGSQHPMLDFEQAKAGGRTGKGVEIIKRQRAAGIVPEPKIMNGKAKEAWEQIKKNKAKGIKPKPKQAK